MFPQLFHRQSTKKTKEQEYVSETLRTLIDARFDRLEQNMKAMELEWADVYDKIMLLYDRTRKRIAASKKAAGEETHTEQSPALPLTREDILRAYIAQNGRDNG